LKGDSFIAIDDRFCSSAFDEMRFSEVEVGPPNSAFEGRHSRESDVTSNSAFDGERFKDFVGLFGSVLEGALVKAVEAGLRRFGSVRHADGWLAIESIFLKAAM